MKLNKNVELVLSYGGVVSWGAFRFFKGIDFETGKAIYKMWYLGRLVGKYNEFKEMKKDHYKMIEEA